MSGRLAGKVSIVTGAGSGIGREIARQFLAEGASLVLVDRVQERLDAVVSELGSGAPVLGVLGDVTDAVACANTVKQAAKRFGRVDVLVNNAGSERPYGTVAMEESEWDRQVGVNLKSVYLMSHAVWEHMKERRGGIILNASSICGHWAFRDLAAYCTSKAGVMMLTRCMALDGAPFGIRCACVCPGFIDTPTNVEYFAQQPDPAAARAATTSLIPLARMGEAEEIAKAYVYLASDDARWVTGSALTIDGGMIAGMWNR